MVTPSAWTVILDSNKLSNQRAEVDPERGQEPLSNFQPGLVSALSAGINPGCAFLD